MDDKEKFLGVDFPGKTNFIPGKKMRIFVFFFVLSYFNFIVTFSYRCLLNTKRNQIVTSNTTTEQHHMNNKIPTRCVNNERRKIKIRFRET